MFQFQAFSSRRFQRGFDRVNLNHPTEGRGSVASMLSAASRMLPICSGAT